MGRYIVRYISTDEKKPDCSGSLGWPSADAVLGLHDAHDPAHKVEQMHTKPLGKVDHSDKAQDRVELLSHIAVTFSAVRKRKRPRTKVTRAQGWQAQKRQSPVGAASYRASTKSLGARSPT